MIGIDTNILVRHLTQDDAAQAQIAEQIFEDCANTNNSLFINNIVICELIWVLERGYKYSKEEIGQVIKQILSTENQYIQNKLDFSDALIGEINKEAGCSKTLTFDQAAATVDYFLLATNMHII
jgi:predicted nucleic-acid-binding protein